MTRDARTVAARDAAGQRTKNKNAPMEASSTRARAPSADEPGQLNCQAVDCVTTTAKMASVIARPAIDSNVRPTRWPRASRPDIASGIAAPIANRNIGKTRSTQVNAFHRGSNGGTPSTSVDVHRPFASGR